jgi:Sec-independent protein translocase protein TatA
MILLFIGTGELLLIIAVTVLLLSPEKALVYARQLGRFYHKVVKLIADIRSEISLTDIDDKDNDGSSRAG